MKYFGDLAEVNERETSATMKAIDSQFREVKNIVTACDLAAI